LAALVSGFVPSAFFPVGAAALSGVTPPAATSEAVAAGGSVTSWTFGAFTDPDGRIASYTATLVTVTGSGSLSGIGLGPYSITGTAGGDAYTVELDALGGEGGVLATAVHTVDIAGAGVISTGDYVLGGYHDFDGVDEYIDFSRIPACEVTTGSAWTVSLWVKRTGSQNMFFAVDDAQDVVRVYENSSQQLMVELILGNQSYIRYRNGSLLNKWVHIVAVSDGSDLSVYLDGSSVTLSSIGTYPTATQTWTASTRVEVGRYPSGFYASAQIAEVAMWSTDQSANVAAIYNSRARHDLMDLATPPDLFYAPLTSYGDNPDGTTGGVFEAVAGNDGTGVNMEAADAVKANFP